MYQAIVFLPLLGCILAALISLVGAQHRHPGASPLASAHGHHAREEHVARLTEHGGHVDAAAAVGTRTAELTTTTFLFISMLL